MGEYSKALLYHEKALEIRQKSLPPDHPDLVRSYDYIALLQRKNEEHSKALSSCKGAMGIRQH
jgi:hypothetical protein